MVSKSWMLVAAMAIGNVCAQEPVAADAGASPPAASAVAASTTIDTASVAIDKPACQALCAGSEIELEIAEPISSKRHKKGDHFALRLATALTVGSDVYVPAGTTGTGEIIHASPSRVGGKPGELLLAARQLETGDGQRIALRAMKLSARGKDNINASLTTVILFGPVGLFVHGGEIEIPAGTRAIAKLAQDVPLTAPQPAAAQIAAIAAPASEALPDGGASQPTPHPPEVPEGTATQL